MIKNIHKLNLLYFCTQSTTISTGIYCIFSVFSYKDSYFHLNIDRVIYSSLTANFILIKNFIIESGIVKDYLIKIINVWIILKSIRLTNILIDLSLFNTKPNRGLFDTINGCKNMIKFINNRNLNEKMVIFTWTWSRFLGLNSGDLFYLSIFLETTTLKIYHLSYKYSKMTWICKWFATIIS